MGKNLSQNNNNYPSYEELDKVLDDQSEILYMISKGEELPKILAKIIDWVERRGNDSLASILLLDESGTKLLHGAAQSLPDDYNQAIHGIAIGQNVGSCGTAAYTLKPVIVEDIENDPLWAEFKHLALEHGLRACWSSPLLSRQGTILGTFAIYYRHTQKPSKQDLQFIQLVSQTTVVAIEFDKANKERLALLEKEKASHEKNKTERQRLYRVMMDSPAMIAVLYGPDHVFEFVNEMYVMAAGKDRSLIGLPISKALPEVMDQGIGEILDGVYQKDQPFYGNELLVKLDRRGKGILEDRYFNFVYQPLHQETGNVEGIFVHAIDVTNQVLSRKTVEESEQRVRSVVENAPFPIGVYIGKEMKVSLANQSIIDVWGKGNNVIGKRYGEILPELANQGIYEQLDNVYTTGIPFHARNQRVDIVVEGSLQPFYFNYSFTPLYDIYGNIYGVMNTAAEITDLVRTQQRLAETRENLQNAIEVAELGTWSMDLKTNYVSCSSRMAEWFGLNSEKASIEEIMNSIDSNDHSKVADAISNSTRNGDVYDVEYLVRNKHTGRERILHARGQLSIAADGTSTSLTGIAQDVTLQKMTERELESQVSRRTEELRKTNSDLQSLNENLQQFAYVASHDLQEPLRKINLYSDLVSKSDMDNLSSTGKSYLKKVSKSAERMSALIKDLLALSRVEGNSKEFVTVDLNTLLKNITTDFELLINEKHAHVTVDNLCTVDAIPLQMNQLFYNLVGNALKFSKPEEPPQVTISSRILSDLEVQELGDINLSWQYCKISVKDNGVGFDEIHSDQIFELFQRLYSKDEYDGTGVGLALCKRIVQNHQGIIAAKSQVGVGSTFVVVLPLKRI